MNDTTRSTSPSGTQPELDQLSERLVHLRAEESAAREQVSVWINAVQLALRDHGPVPATGARSQWRAAVAKLDASLAEFEQLALARR